MTPPTLTTRIQATSSSAPTPQHQLGAVPPLFTQRSTSVPAAPPPPRLYYIRNRRPRLSAASIPLVDLSPRSVNPPRRNDAADPRFGSYTVGNLGSYHKPQTPILTPSPAAPAAARRMQREGNRVHREKPTAIFPLCIARTRRLPSPLSNPESDPRAPTDAAARRRYLRLHHHQLQRRLRRHFRHTAARLRHHLTDDIVRPPPHPPDILN
ncbi:hypothetical protein R3P38DRAFT_3181681 [Favolaschia claudopus]|uniref:Uncharacterized protein n=1 Tax=Favolaschia claudopus TaxID=2862362 RepID=A0AAW0CLZ2_9AGAR